MGMKELHIYIYISMYIEWVNLNTWFTYLLMSTFSYMDNVQRIYYGPLYLLHGDSLRWDF